MDLSDDEDLLMIEEEEEEEESSKEEVDSVVVGENLFEKFFLEDLCRRHTETTFRCFQDVR